jgi:hypothetical protein
MNSEFDAKLTGLAAEILREAVRNCEEVTARLRGYPPATVLSGSVMFSGLEATRSFQGVTGSLPALTGSLPALTSALPALTASLPALTASFQAIGPADTTPDEGTLRGLLRLPPKLPGVLLPPDEVLALAARSAPIMVHLAALARWLGDGGRAVADADRLSAAHAAEAARALGVDPGYLPYLWEYGLASGWIMLADDEAGRRSWAVPGPASFHWAADDVPGTLHVWAAVFAAVLVVALDAAAQQEPGAGRWEQLDGQGVILAVVLFLARQSGLTVAEAADLVRVGAVGEGGTGRARREWSARVGQFGDPAVRLLAELAELRAVELPAGGTGTSKTGTVVLAPLAQWALRAQFALDGIKVPLLRTSAQRSAADLVAIAGGLSETVFDTEFTAWLLRTGPARAAQELLLFAGSAEPDARLVAVKLARRIGAGAVHAWLDAMKRPELRGYARIALSLLAADLPDSSLPLVLNPDPDDLDGMAADLVLLMGSDDIPDPDRIEALFAEAVPKGEEEWVIGLLAGGRHRDIVRLLELLSHCYSNRRLAKSARRAARTAARNFSASEHGQPSARANSR